MQCEPRGFMRHMGPDSMLALALVGNEGGMLPGERRPLGALLHKKLREERVARRPNVEQRLCRQKKDTRGKNDQKVKTTKKVNNPIDNMSDRSGQ